MTNDVKPASSWRGEILSALKKDLKYDLAWVAAVFGAVFAASHARKLGDIDPETVTRIFQCACGLYMAWVGNRIPKAVAPSAIVGQVARFGGWSLTLGGLAYVGLWAFAPVSTTLVIVACATVLTSIAAPVAYALYLARKSV